jgi:CRP-like cAMP-binding protein
MGGLRNEGKGGSIAIARTRIAAMLSADHPLLEPFSPALRSALLGVARPRRLGPGERLFSRGDRADGWWGLVSGAMKVGNVNDDGREMVLSYLEPGTWFGELSLFDGLPRSHDNFAHGDSTLVLISASDFHRLRADFPEIGDFITRQHCARLRLLFSAVEDATLLPLSARLQKQLLALASSYGVPLSDSPRSRRIAIKISQESLAQMVGASRQRLNQELKRLEALGDVAYRDGYLVVRT